MPSNLPKPALFLTAIFAFLGFADAAYLTADHYLAVPLPCSLTQGCDVVLNSQYATVGPVPVALLGALYYLAAFFLAIYIFSSESPKVSAARAIQGLSGLGLLASVYLVYLQFEIIRALCMYCLISATMTLLLFLSSSWLASRMSRQAKLPA